MNHVTARTICCFSPFAALSFDWGVRLCANICSFPYIHKAFRWCQLSISGRLCCVYAGMQIKSGLDAMNEKNRINNI